MKILLTGFEPFNGRIVNPSQLLLEQVQAPERVTLIKQLLPVEFHKCTTILKELMQEHEPDIVLSLGQAGNYPEISIEKVAINLIDCRSLNGKKRLADNAGDVFVNEPIEPDGEIAYFATLPIWDMAEAIQNAGIGAVVSYSAGTYVCNHVMYTVLHETKNNYPNTKAGFVHVPFLPEQNPKRGHTMEFEKMLIGVQAVIDFLGKGI